MKRAADAGAILYPVKIIKPDPGSISEIFSGIQGEGTRVGERHLFIRFGGCPFRCNYCDTPSSLVAPDTCLVEDPPASGKFRKHPNPVAPDKLVEIAGHFVGLGGLYRAISLTGGEPLWQTDYLRAALPLLRTLGKTIYLETAGAHPAELKSILDLVDVVAMDIKLPSTTGLKPMWAVHQEFLKTALSRQVIVKAVVIRKTPTHEIEMVRKIVGEVDRTIPVVIQPVTPAWKAKSPPTPSQLLAWQALLAERLENVKVIPQCHRMMGGA